MEHRYIVIRKHLDELGYQQPLSLETVPLVERLLADLVKTTESLYHYKNVAQTAIEVCKIIVTTINNNLLPYLSMLFDYF